VVVIAAERSLPRARAFLNASRLPPRQVLAVGGLARRQARAVSLALRLGVSVSQVSLLLVGGEDEPDLVELRRYTVAAGIPVEALERALKPEPEERDRWSRPAAPNAPPAARGLDATARAAALIADAVLRDRRRVLCCGVFAEATHGLPTIFATLPAIIGRHGCEDIFPASLTLEERSFLQRVAAPSRDDRAGTALPR
jgi:malate dehydrogenase